MLLRKIVIYLVSRTFYLRGHFYAVEVDGSDVNLGICLITPGSFNMQTSHGFENFCSFSSNSTYSNKIVYTYFSEGLLAVNESETLNRSFTIILAVHQPYSIMLHVTYYVYIMQADLQTA